MAVAVIHSISRGLPGKFQSLSLSSTPTAASAAFRPLSFSSTTSFSLFSKGLVLVSPVQMPLRRSIVCEAAPKKKADSAAKRARQAEKRRVYNKARKSEIRTRMKKVNLLCFKLNLRNQEYF
ncbi:30S ribosomal S20, chloroplastic [Olea europaea subsp. europaea]|uniref:30S ribosomal S20, chloroplastic n=1 Tax=Olea europaea subsp. europaea TaxID=158383 RepID=A0A8S0PQM0_OLEEU|nr:30S ribosomal S20, chloroplastic [Olea europaea subsp. europaea]